MNQILKFLLVLFLISICSPAMVWAGDLDNGFAAFEKGDYAKAVYWFRKAAEQGNAEAQYTLGVMYDNGRGVTRDLKEAVKLHRKSIEQENSVRQADLARIYTNCSGVAKYENEALKLYKLSVAPRVTSDLTEENSETLEYQFKE